MNKRFGLAAIVTIGLFAGVVWFIDPFLLFVLGVAPLLWIGLPALYVAVMMLISDKGTGRSRRLPINLLLSVLGFGCFVGLAIPANHFIQTHAEADAMAYPERITPLLEAYKQTHGNYPAQLDQLPAHAPPPRLLRKSSYNSDGQSYWFTFPQPGGLIDEWNYDSKTHAWHLST